MSVIVAAADSDLVGIAPAEKMSEKTRRLASAVALLASKADHVVFCHGGKTETRYIRDVLAEGAREGIDPGAPIDTCVAMSEGYLAFHLLEALEEALRAAGRTDALPAGAILTQVAPAQSGGLPVVLELPAIRTLLKSHALLIAGGSGGIPVRRTQDGWEGGSAVPDLASTAAALASGTGAERLVFLVDDRMQLPEGPFSADRALEACEDGSTPAGLQQMLKAAAAFVQGAAGCEALIVPVGSVENALAGREGLRITES